MSENGEIQGRPPSQVPGLITAVLQSHIQPWSGVRLRSDQNDVQSRHRLDTRPWTRAGHECREVAWPPLLDNRISIELVLKVFIGDCQGDAVEAHIVTFLSAPLREEQLRQIALQS